MGKVSVFLEVIYELSFEFSEGSWMGWEVFWVEVIVSVRGLW